MNGVERVECSVEREEWKRRKGGLAVEAGSEENVGKGYLEV